jgi:hypothetical protein
MKKAELKIQSLERQR